MTDRPTPQPFAPDRPTPQPFAPERRQAEVFASGHRQAEPFAPAKDERPEHRPPDPPGPDPDPNLVPQPAMFEVGLARWTLILPGLPIGLGAAVTLLEIALAQRPLAGLLLLVAGLVVAWLRTLSRVRIAHGSLLLRWLWPIEQRVDLERLVAADPARSLSFGLGAVNVLRLRDRRGAVVDLPLDRWARESELRAIVAAAARRAGV